MSISDKIRNMLTVRNMNLKDLAVYFDISVQAVRNKFFRESFSAKDLIIIAESAGFELCFIPPAYDGSEEDKISFSIEDLDEEDIFNFFERQKKVEVEKINKWNKQLESMSPDELKEFKENLENIMKDIQDKHKD